MVFIYHPSNSEVDSIGGLINNLLLGVVESVIPKKGSTIFVNISMTDRTIKGKSELQNVIIQIY